jgi:putative hemolysin
MSGGQTGAAVTKTLSALPSCNADKVERFYFQLSEIHAIALAQLAACSRWHQSVSTSSPARTETSRQGASREALHGNDGTTTTNCFLSPGPVVVTGPAH